MPRVKFVRRVLVAATLWVAPAVVPAADFYWRGDLSGTWSTSVINTNFSSDSGGFFESFALPGAGDTVRFAASNTANLNTTLGANFSIFGLTTESNLLSSVSISGNTLTLGAGGIVTSGPTTLILNSALASLSGAHFINTANPTSTVSITSNITTGLSLTKTGAGTLILSGANTFASGTTLNNGTLQINSASALPAGRDVTINSGLLDLRASVNLGNINFGNGTSTGTVRTISTTNASSITLSGNINLTSPGSGAVVKAPVVLTAGQHDIRLTSTAFSSSFYDFTFTQPLSGTGGVNLTSTGYVAFTASSSYAGPTNLTNGVAFVAAPNAFPSTTALTVSFPGELRLNPTSVSADVTIGNYSQTVASLSGNGFITLGSGVLSVGDASSTSFSGIIQGANGRIVKQGVGTLTLSGSNTYTGGTTIVAGAITATAANAVPANTPLTIGQSSSSSNGRFNTGGLAHSLSGLTVFAQNPGSNVIDVGTGTLTLGGNISLLDTVSSAGNRFGATIAAGAGGTLDLGGGVRNITLAGQNNAQDELVINAVIANGGINLTANPSTANGSAAGLILNASVPNTYAGGTTVNAGVLTVAPTTTLGAPTGSLTIFSSSPVSSTVNLSSPQSIGSLTGGAISSGAVTLNLNTSATTLTVSPSGVNVFGGNIAGPGSLVINGTGTLGVSNASYTGPTTITQGTLSFSVDSIPFSLPGGNFSVAGNLNLGNTLVTPLNIPNTISGTGTVALAGLDGAADIGNFTFSGNLSARTGNLQVGRNNGLNSFDARLLVTAPQSPGPGPIVVLPGSQLHLAGGTYPNAISIAGTGFLESAGTFGALRLSNSPTLTGPVTLTASATIHTAASSTSTLSGTVSGPFPLEKTGPGTLILTANNTYAGDTTVSEGVLQIGNGGTTGVVTGNITNNGTVVFNRSSALNYSGVISGSGSLTKLGAGNLLVIGDFIYSGSTTINEGALQFGDNTPAGAIPAGNIIVNSQVTFFVNNLATLSIPSTFSGAGGVLLGGPDNVPDRGSYQFAGNNSAFSGSIQLGAQGFDARLIATSSQNLGTAFINISEGSGIFLSGGTYANAFNLRGNGWNESAGFLGAMRLDAATVTGAVSLVANARIAATGASSSTLSGAISGAFALEKTGPATLILSANNTLTGPVTVSAGTLQIGNASTTGSLLGPITNNASVVFNRSDSPTHAGLITGTGSITKQGAGTVSFSAGQSAPYTASSISITAGAVNLTDNDIILRSMSEASVRSLVGSGQIFTSLASPTTPGSFTTLAVFPNNAGNNIPFYSAYGNVPLTPSDVIVKYTYIGDTNLDGKVDGTDVANAIEGYSTGGTGWANGDTNYDGVVNATDISRVLSSLANQGAPLGVSPVIGGGVVPEPTGLAFGVPVIGLLSARRRRR